MRLRQFSAKTFLNFFFILFSKILPIFYFLADFLRRIALSRCPSHTPKPPIHYGSPVCWFLKEIGEKNGFPMPTATNRFQIRNLHPKT